MNFVFILDSSVSMTQTFEGITFFEAAKGAIYQFVLKREILNNRLKIKCDKYFLMTTSENVEQSIISHWGSSTEHLVYQLRSLQISYDFTNIDFALQNAFNMLNYIKIIGFEKHIHGRLFSNVQNSFVIFITNGSKLCSSKKVQNIADISMIKMTQDKVYYKELYRWDQSLYSIVLGNEDICPASEALKKYSTIVNGQVLYAQNIIALRKIVDELSENVLYYNRVYVNFKLFQRPSQSNNNILPIIGQIEYLSDEVIKDKWPFPDELLIEKTDASLPIKKAIPTYLISNEFKVNFTIPSTYYDEYDIIDVKNFSKLLMNDTIPNILHNETNIYWDVMIDIPNAPEGIAYKPFAVLLLKYNRNEEENNNKNATLSTPSANKIITNKKLQLKFLVLPYNYNDFYSITSKYEQELLSKPEAFIQIEKYFAKIPFYYKPYIGIFLEKKNILKLEDNFYKLLDLEHISDSVLKEIKEKCNIENDQFQEIKKSFSKSKKLHISRLSPCCRRENVYKPKSTLDCILSLRKNEVIYSTTNEHKAFLNKCFNITKSLKQSENDKSIQGVSIITSSFGNYQNKKDNNEVEIDMMGEYSKYKFIRDHHYYDEEIKIFIADIFGNPFKQMREMYITPQGLNNYSSQFYGIGGFNQENIILNTKSEDELSVYPTNLSKKTARDSSTNLPEAKKSLFIIYSDDSHPSSTASSSHTPVNSIQKHNDDLIQEFKDYLIVPMNKKGIKYRTNHRIMMNELYDWKVKSQLKNILKNRINNCYKGKEDFIKLIDDIISFEDIFLCKEQKKMFIINLIKNCDDLGIDKLVINKINKRINKLI